MKHRIFNNLLLFITIFCLFDCDEGGMFSGGGQPCACDGSACDSVGEIQLNNYVSVTPGGFNFVRGSKIVIAAGYSIPFCGSVSSVTLKLEHPERTWTMNDFTVHENRWSFGGNFIYTDIEIPLTATRGNYKCTLTIITSRGNIAGGYYSVDYVITE